MNAPAAITIATATALVIAGAVPAQGVALSTRLYQGHAIIDVVGRSSPATRIASWLSSKRRREPPWSCSTRAAA